MSTRTWAWMQVGPWDESALKTNEAGRELLEALEEAGFDDREVIEKDGVALFSASKSEADYGTSAFAGLEDLAVAAGLWWGWGDDGGGNWDADHAIGSPSGKVWQFNGTVGNTVLTSGQIKLIKDDVGPERLGHAIERHVALGNRTLAEWIKAGEDAA